MPEKEAQTEEPNAAAESAESTAAATTDSGSDFLTEAEKETLQEWTIYITGLFAALGVAIGLNGIIQDQWDHSLISYSGSGGLGGAMQALVNGSIHTGNLWTIMMIGIVGATGLGILYAKYVDNENQTAFKLGAATAIVGVPVLLVVGTFLYTLQLDNWDPEFANLVVSGLGAGIAGAIGSAIAIWLTENNAPEALN